MIKLISPLSEGTKIAPFLWISWELSNGLYLIRRGLPVEEIIETNSIWSNWREDVEKWSVKFHNETQQISEEDARNMLYRASILKETAVSYIMNATENDEKELDKKIKELLRMRRLCGDTQYGREHEKLANWLIELSTLRNERRKIGNEKEAA